MDAVFRISAIVLLSVAMFQDVLGMRTNTARATCSSKLGLESQPSVWMCPCAGSSCLIKTVTDPNMPFSPAYKQNSTLAWAEMTAKAKDALKRISKVKGTSTRKGLFQELTRVSMSSLDETATGGYINEHLAELGLDGLLDHADLDWSSRRGLKKKTVEKQKKKSIEKLFRSHVLVSEYLRQVLEDELNGEDLAECNKQLVQREYAVYDVIKDILCIANTHLQLEYAMDLSDVISQGEIDRTAFLKYAHSELDSRTDRYERDYALYVYTERLMDSTKVFSERMTSHGGKKQKKDRKKSRKNKPNRNRRRHEKRQNKRNLKSD